MTKRESLSEKKKKKKKKIRDSLIYERSKNIINEASEIICAIYELLSPTALLLGLDDRELIQFFFFSFLQNLFDLDGFLSLSTSNNS